VLFLLLLLLLLPRHIQEKVAKLLTKHRKSASESQQKFGPAILTAQQFENHWEAFTQGMFKGLKWENVFVAGGAVLGSCLVGLRPVGGPLTI